MGVLPSQTIRELVRLGCIEGIDESFINPSSLDMPVSSEAYRLEKTFMPQPGETIRGMLSWAGATLHDLKAPLEVGVTYLVKLDGSLNLLENLYAYANPKSSTGRLNVFARMLADSTSKYDTLERGWKGEVWMQVQAGSFPVLLHPGIPLIQLRFFDNKSFLNQTHLGLAIKEYGLFFDRNGVELPPNKMRSDADSLYLSIRADDGVVGWECTGSNKILDLSEKPGSYQPKEFAFKPVVAEDGGILLLPDNFYILTTDEFIKVPPNCSAELRATDVRVGEFRSHFAGFIDAGWGCGRDLNGRGQPITLEVVISERVPSFFRHRQFVAKIRYERMSEVPEVPYDAANSNYTGQVTAKLSKLFAS